MNRRNFITAVTTPQRKGLGRDGRLQPCASGVPDRLPGLRSSNSRKELRDQHDSPDILRPRWRNHTETYHDAMSLDSMKTPGNKHNRTRAEYSHAGQRHRTGRRARARPRSGSLSALIRGCDGVDSGCSARRADEGSPSKEAQRRDAPESAPSQRVAAKPGVCGVALPGQAT